MNYVSEAEGLGDVYSGFPDFDGSAESIAEMEYAKAETLANLIGSSRLTYPGYPDDDEYMVFQIGKDDKILLLIDRSKSKKHWWTGNPAMAIHGSKEAMEKIASKYKYNNVSVIRVKDYIKRINNN